MNKHKQKRINFKGQKILIDEEIAPLLRKMWRLGIITNGSCQASCNFNCKHKYKKKHLKDGRVYSAKIKTKNCHNNIWIVFATAKDIELFYNIVAEYCPDTFYHKDFYKNKDKMYCKMHGSAIKDNWALSYSLYNNGVEGHFGRPTINGKRNTYSLWMEDGCGENNFIVQPQLTFPRAHLKYVEERLDLELKRNKK